MRVLVQEPPPAWQRQLAKGIALRVPPPPSRAPRAFHATLRAAATRYLGAHAADEEEEEDGEEGDSGGGGGGRDSARGARLGGRGALTAALAAAGMLPDEPADGDFVHWSDASSPSSDDSPSDGTAAAAAAAAVATGAPSFHSPSGGADAVLSDPPEQPPFCLPLPSELSDPRDSQALAAALAGGRVWWAHGVADEVGRGAGWTGKEVMRSPLPDCS
jgi:hypothetical protein